MQKDIQRELRSLKIYNAFLTLLVVSLFLFSFSGSKDKIDELTVQRLNVVDSTGRLQLVLANKSKFPERTIAGKVFAQGQRGPGMLFFNDEGDECGGYAWGSEKNGAAGGVFSFDQYKQDQAVSIIYQESSGVYGDRKKERYAGLSVKSWPTEIPVDEMTRKYATARAMKDSAIRSNELKKLNAYFTSMAMFVGKKQNDDIGVFITDAHNKPRLKLYTDKEGNPKLEFLDSLGKVFYRFPKAD